MYICKDVYEKSGKLNHVSKLKGRNSCKNDSITLERELEL
jgi:hypothetical protein